VNDRVGDATDAPGWDQYYGYGRLNAKNAVQLALANSTSAPTLTNISTRVSVGTGDNVSIVGFIIKGTQPKKVLIRGLGPTLTQFGVPNVLPNPELELHDARGPIGRNDDWQVTQLGGTITQDQVAEIQSTQKAPPDSSESAIVATLPPGNYTAILRGVGGTTGVGLVEVYDLAPASASRLTNISTRGFVQTGDNVMIGGMIVVTQPTRVIIRAIGPSLTPFGITNALVNPQLELFSGASIVARNDNWQTTQIGGMITGSQVSAIQANGYAPGNANESAIIATLPPGNYTAIVRGVSGTIGTALVEAYMLE
jgi:hypothetical protein